MKEHEEIIEICKQLNQQNRQCVIEIAMAILAYQQSGPSTGFFNDQQVRNFSF